MSKGTPIIGIRLDSEIRKSLEAVCDQQQLTISDAVRLAILEFIENRKAE